MPKECTLVGDSVTDIEGARLASVQSIGYANKPGTSASARPQQVPSSTASPT